MTADFDIDPWAVLDDALGVDSAVVAEEQIGLLAFYGRCSTEDNQDPETSLGWQLGNATKFVGPLGGEVVAQYFDVGQSRSVPWERRGAGAQLLAALKDPRREWTGVVVGEGTRCWFGNQFSLIAPRFAAYGVDLWVPELGGKFDARNPSHKMLMSVLGGMSESERQHVQARVRSAMDAQVINEGRHQGGRAPYGYRVVDGGPHPNPRKAAEGFRLRVLEIDEPAADVVRRMFAEYLVGVGDRVIARGLNQDGIPCPSKARPEQNRHRPGDGWQGSTVRAILENPRYTGYAVFGRWTKHERLLNPDDVSAGYVVRFRKSDPGTVVRSRRQSHPEIVSVETFAQAQLLRRSRGAGGMRGIAKLERDRPAVKNVYLLKGLIRCEICGRKMQGAPIRKAVYYRCIVRTLAPGSPALASHPKTVNLREDVVMPALNGWLCQVFDPANRDETVAALLASQGGMRSTGRESAERRLADAESRLRRHQAAIEAGVDPAAVVEAINTAQAEREAARAELQHLPKATVIEAAEVYARLDSMDDVARALNSRTPERITRVYQDLGVQLRYDNEKEAVVVTASPRMSNVCVRGGTRSRLLARIPCEREFVMRRSYQVRSSRMGIRHCRGRAGGVRRLVRQEQKRRRESWL